MSPECMDCQKKLDDGWVVGAAGFQCWDCAKADLVAAKERE